MTDPSSNWTPVAKTTEIPPGTGKEVVVAGQIVAVFNIDGVFHAMDGVCPHAGGPVGTGRVEGCIVTCPWHGWQFDVTTGQNVLNTTLQHPVYPTRTTGESVEVLIETGS